MRCGTYTFVCLFTSSARLPVFKGSTLRGGFGHALKRVCCALPRQECARCLLFETCAYAFFFELHEIMPPGKNSLRIAHRPHPYVVVPPENEQRDYETGESLRFSIRLFGRANDFLPHVLYAVQETGRQGLGKGPGGRFEVKEVLCGGETVFDGNVITPGRGIKDLSLQSPDRRHCTGLTLEMRTPLRLKHNNRFQDRLPFHLVIRGALRRVATLEKIYGEGEIDLDFRGLVARAEKIEIAEEKSSWQEFSRYSNRQKKAMNFGGIMGRNVYHGEGLEEFLPCLYYCRETHLGKQTSFGLGRVEITVNT